MTRSRYTDSQDYRAMAAAEEARVRDLIERDARYEQQERFRKEAEFEVAGGKVSLTPETTIEPTPEWLAKGDVETYIPRQAEGTTVLIKTKRRVSSSTVVKMCFDGKITEDQFLACRWYRSLYEASGLDGRFKSSHISMTAGTSGGGSGWAQHPMAAHEREADSRNLFRIATSYVNKRFLPVFNNVVIFDMSLRAAASSAKRDNSRLLQNFRYSAQQLVKMCEDRKITLLNRSENDG